MNFEKLLKTNKICEVVEGSHAYGTNIETSDFDTRGIFCADPISLRTPFFPVKEIEVKENEDTKFYELNHFMKLLVDQNPNIIQVLWVKEKSIIFSTDAYNLLRERRDDFLSSKIAFTTSGYAHSQLKRMASHRKWINNPQPTAPPSQKDYFSLSQWLRREEVVLPNAFNIIDYAIDHRLIHYGNQLYGLYEFDGFHMFQSDGSIKDNFDGNRSDLSLPKAIIKFNKTQWLVDKNAHKNYWNWKKNRNPERAKIEENHQYDCYSDDTEFLTNNGWKLFDVISESDKLATFNIDNKKIEYQKYLKRIDNLYTGQMYSIKTLHTDIRVTANHNMVSSQFSHTKSFSHNGWKLTPICKLTECEEFLNVLTPKTNVYEPPYIKTKYNISLSDYLQLIGWYISDRYSQFNKSIIISQSNPDSSVSINIKKMRTKYNNFGSLNTYPPTGISKCSEKKFKLPHDVSKLLFDDCGYGSNPRRIPSWVKELPTRQINFLLKALIQADGTKITHQNSTYIYCTSNKLLSDDINELAVLTGIETSVRTLHQYETNYNTIIYQVHLNFDAPKVRKFYRKSDIKTKMVNNERVVCFMVPNSTLITRRNGHVAFHGNCKHAMHLVRLMRMGYEALTENVINVYREDHKELIDIRNGSMSCDELIAYANDMDIKIKREYKKSKLKKKVDLKLAAEITMDAQDLIWGKTSTFDNVSDTTQQSQKNSGENIGNY